MRKSKTFSFKVTVKAGNCTKSEAKKYIKTAVSRWCKGYDVTSAEWEIGDSVKVEPIRDSK